MLPYATDDEPDGRQTAAAGNWHTIAPAFKRYLCDDTQVPGRTTGATPMLPSACNNYKRVVQTEDHIMILIEMNHAARRADS